jgi:hypothetical protein
MPREPVHLGHAAITASLSQERRGNREINHDREQILNDGRQRAAAKGRVDPQTVQGPRERHGNQIGRRTGSENSESNR